MSDVKRSGGSGGPSSNEEEYFARREADLLRQQRDAAEKAAAEAERRSHHMKCPKCGYDLISQDWQGVTIDQCTNCHGLWFDAGEVEQVLKQKDTGLFGRLLGSVMQGVSGKKAPAK